MRNNLLTSIEIKDLNNNYMYSKIYNNFEFLKIFLKKKNDVLKLYKNLKNKNLFDEKFIINLEIINKIFNKIDILDLRIKISNLKKKRIIKKNKTQTQKKLLNLILNYDKIKTKKQFHSTLYKYVKKFEVNKKLFTEYDHKLKFRKSDVEDIESQFVLLLLLVMLFLDNKYNLIYINCLLKIIDKIIYKFQKKLNKVETLMVVYINYYLIFKLKQKYAQKK